MVNFAIQASPIWAQIYEVSSKKAKFKKKVRKAEFLPLKRDDLALT